MDKFEAQALTYKEFFEKFNAISQDYRAYSVTFPVVADVVAIFSYYNHHVMASLASDDRTWDFNESTFNSKELLLMAKLAATSPKLRGGIDNERD